RAAVRERVAERVVERLPAPEPLRRGVLPAVRGADAVPEPRDGAFDGSHVRAVSRRCFTLGDTGGWVEWTGEWKVRRGTRPSLVGAAAAVRRRDRGGRLRRLAEDRVGERGDDGPALLQRVRDDTDVGGPGLGRIDGGVWEDSVCLV